MLPDGHPKGEPIVPNGLALCKPHHAAFDRYFLGIRPDLVIEVRRDIMDEADGPMLRRARLWLRPAPDFLAERFEVFGRRGRGHRSHCSRGRWGKRQ